MTLPALTVLKQSALVQHLAVQTPPAFASFLKREACVDQVFIDVNSKRTASHVRRQGPWDLGVLFPNSFASAYHMWRAKVQRRVGYARDGRSLFLTEALPWPQQRHSQHQAAWFLKLVAHALQEEVPRLENIQIPLQARALHADTAFKNRIVQQHLQSSRPWVVMSVAAAYGPAKEWLPERYKKLAQDLYSRYHALIIFLGRKQDQAKVQFIVRNEPQDMCWDLCGQTTLSQAEIILESAQAFVGNDSGLAHLAARKALPTVVMFGSTSPQFTRPLGKQVHVMYEDLECSPCFKRSCPLRTMQCMREIKVSPILDLLSTYLEKTSLLQESL